MSYRSDLADVLRYKGYEPAPEGPVTVRHEGAAVLLAWAHPTDPRPVEAQVDAWAAEPGYAVWQAQQQIAPAFVTLLDTLATSDPAPAMRARADLLQRLIARRTRKAALQDLRGIVLDAGGRTVAERTDALLLAAIVLVAEGGS